MDGSLELIVGTHRVQPMSVEWIEGGLVAAMDSAGFLSLVDATFGGALSDVQLCTGRPASLPRDMVVTAISMRGRSAFVTLQETGLAPVLN